MVRRRHFLADEADDFRFRGKNRSPGDLFTLDAELAVVARVLAIIGVDTDGKEPFLLGIPAYFPTFGLDELLELLFGRLARFVLGNGRGLCLLDGLNTRIFADINFFTFFGHGFAVGSRGFVFRLILCHNRAGYSAQDENQGDQNCRS